MSGMVNGEGTYTVPKKRQRGNFDYSWHCPDEGQPASAKHLEAPIWAHLSQICRGMLEDALKVLLYTWAFHTLQKWQWNQLQRWGWRIEWRGRPASLGFKSNQWKGLLVYSIMGLVQLNFGQLLMRVRTTELLHEERRLWGRECGLMQSWHRGGWLKHSDANWKACAACRLAGIESRWSTMKDERCSTKARGWAVIQMGTNLS